MRRALLLSFTLLVTGCGSPRGGAVDLTDVTPGDVPTAPADVVGELPPLAAPETLWPGETPAPDWPAWADSHPWLREELSAWSFQVDGDLPHFRYLPDLGVGNGHVFSLAGYAAPLNTLHSMTGPSYDKGEGFFGDVTTTVTAGPDGEPLAWTRQWSGKPRTAPMALTAARGPHVRLFTLDFAPLAGDETDPARRALVRVVTVSRPGATPVKDLHLRLTFARPQAVDGAVVVETRENRTRRTTALGEPEAVADGGGLSIPLGTIPGGGERVVVLAFVMDDDTEQAAQTLARLESAGVDSLLDETRAAWEAILADSMQVTTPDTRVNDYLRSQLLVVLSQQAWNGSSHPMCEYTGTWLRDNAGPVRLLTRVGLFERVRAQLDYLWLAARVEGSLKNSYLGNFQPDDANPEPDWAALPVMTGRTRAESPSYLPLMYHWYRQASGRNDFVTVRLAMLRYALEKQEFTDDLLPFSTDETFRTAMAVAHGLAVDEQFETGYFSANSSFLWVAAAQALAAMAESAGETAAAKALRQRAQAVRARAEAVYRADDGHYHPYLAGEAMTPAPAPFEDVNTKPLWCGYAGTDDPAALDNLERTVEMLGGEDGVLVSPLPEELKNLFGLPIAEGLYTGMSPGYFLYDLAVTGHPLAQAAFNALAQHATATGTTPEYAILDDFSPLHFLYDAQGALGDYTARYRPWEGGIVADAALAYLVGNVPDAPAGRLRLAPNLPNGWSWLEATNLRVGDTRLALRVERRGTRWDVRLERTAGPAVTVELSLPLAQPAAPEVAVDGIAVQAEVEALRWGNDRVRVTLEVAEEVAVVVE